MKKINILFAFLFISLITFSFAGNNPEFVIEENGDNYSMYLKLDDVSAVDNITIESNYSQNGVEKTMNIEITAEDLANFGASLAKIQDLSLSHDFANYTVKITNNDGITYAYPIVQVDLSTFDNSFASAN